MSFANDFFTYAPREELIEMIKHLQRCLNDKEIETLGLRKKIVELEQQSIEKDLETTGVYNFK